MEEKGGRLSLTPGGREIAEHMEKVIPYFMNAVFSLRMVSIVTIGVHILLLRGRNTIGNLLKTNSSGDNKKLPF